MGSCWESFSKSYLQINKKLFDHEQTHEKPEPFCFLSKMGMTAKMKILVSLSFIRICENTFLAAALSSHDTLAT